MAEKKVAIPKQLYVTFMEVDLHKWDSVNCKNIITGTEITGFMQHHSDNQAGWKRQANQMHWAYGSHLDTLDGIDDPVLVEQQHPKTRYYGKGWWKVDDHYYVRYYDCDINGYTWQGVPPHLTPKIWDNVPITGFRIVDSISRYSTSNKLWRVLDPRGAILEISTASMEGILMNGTVSNGVIVGECLWKSNKNLVFAHTL